MGCCVRLVLPEVQGPTLDSILGRISRRWGGATMVVGHGFYRTPTVHSIFCMSDTSLVKDDVAVIECSIGRWTEQARQWWTGLARDARRYWEQDCVFLSVRDETAFLVGPDWTEIIGDEDGHI